VPTVEFVEPHSPPTAPHLSPHPGAAAPPQCIWLRRAFSPFSGVWRSSWPVHTAENGRVHGQSVQRSVARVHGQSIQPGGCSDPAVRRIYGNADKKWTPERHAIGPHVRPGFNRSNIVNPNSTCGLDYPNSTGELHFPNSTTELDNLLQKPTTVCAGELMLYLLSPLAG
jgi:hypothetical protein